MPEGQIIVDTGPLVAYVSGSDAHHAWAVEQFRLLPCPFFTCEPVLAETFHLLARMTGGIDAFFDLLTSGLLNVDYTVLPDVKALASLGRKYRDLPVSLADACLVRMSELSPTRVVLTIDSHFRIYRRFGRQLIPTIMPR